MVIQVETDQDDDPLRDSVKSQLQLRTTQHERLEQRSRHSLTDTDKHALSSTGWFSDCWLQELLASAPERFDRAFDQWREFSAQEMPSSRRGGAPCTPLYTARIRN